MTFHSSEIYNYIIALLVTHKRKYFSVFINSRSTVAYAGLSNSMNVSHRIVFTELRLVCFTKDNITSFNFADLLKCDM
jgi:hypothetical protein